MRITQWLSISPDKIEIKREMFPNYRLKIPDLYNIPIGNVKNLVPRFFDIEKNDSLSNLHLYLWIGLELKTMHHVLEFNQSEWWKPYVEFNT